MGAAVVRMRRTDGPYLVPVAYVRKPGDRTDAGIISARSYDGVWAFRPQLLGAGWEAIYTPTGQVLPGEGLHQLRAMAHSPGASEGRLMLDDLAAMGRPCVDRDQQCGGAPAAGVVDALHGPWPVCQAHADALREHRRQVRVPGKDPRPTTPRRWPA